MLRCMACPHPFCFYILVWNLEERWNFFTLFIGRILCLAWDATGDVIVTGSVDAVRIWHVESGHAIHRMTPGRDERKKETIVWCLAVTKDLTIITGDSRYLCLCYCNCIALTSFTVLPYKDVSKSFWTESIMRSTTTTTTTTTNTHWEATQRVMEAKLTRLTHKIVIQLHLVAESCTICISHSRRPVWKLLDTPLHISLFSLFTLSFINHFNFSDW
jgi:WD40 repeat protein